MIQNITINDHKGWLVYLETDQAGDFSLNNNKWNVKIDYNPISAFGNHKFLIDDSDFLILFDGVVFNWSELPSYGNSQSYDKIIKNIWLKESYQFPRLLRGSFNGIIFDKNKEELVIFNDHIGSKAVFYSILSNKNIIVSSDIAKIYDLRTKIGNENRLSISSAQNLLSCGFMMGNETLCNEVLRVIPGTVIRINKSVDEVTYNNINNEEDFDLSETEHINNIEVLFNEAINRQYSVEYEGFEQKDRLESLVCLSGGLDSRMTSLVGHKQGFSNQLNITFSQSGYLDENIAQRIASDYNHDWLFKSLDTGKYLMLVDEITEYTGGNVLYYGLAHGYSMTKLMNLTDYKLLHTGQLGDVVLGSYFSTLDHNKKYQYSDGAFGSFLSKTIINNSEKYANEEIGKFYNRGFNGILISGHTMIQQHMETASPFLDYDFMTYCLRIPIKYRYNHYIYKKWIMEKHPEIAKYEWEKIKAKITTPQISILGRKFPITQVPNILCKKIGQIFFSQKDVLMTKKHMNPIAYHIANNNNVSKYLDNYYNEVINMINDEDLKITVQKLYNDGNSMDKIKCISLLSAIKRFKFI